jgi:hypothetical protein
MTSPTPCVKDPTAAERARRYRERKRHGAHAVTGLASRAGVTASRTVTAARVTLTDHQQVALDLLLDAIEATGSPDPGRTTSPPRRSRCGGPRYGPCSRTTPTRGRWSGGPSRPWSASAA